MPEKKTTQRARRDRRQGKKASTQAGNYVGEEMRHKKSGKHPVKSRKQAVAIGLSKARRAGVKVPRKKSSGAKSSSAKSSTTKRKTRSPKATRTRAKSTRKSAASGHTRRKGSSSTKRSGSASKSRSSRSKSKKS